MAGERKNPSTGPWVTELRLGRAAAPAPGPFVGIYSDPALTSLGLGWAAREYPSSALLPALDRLMVTLGVTAATFRDGR